MSALFDIDPLFESINHQTLLLTSNRRLAAHITSAYAEACSERGLKVWETPAVLPIDDWIERCWQQLINANLPLTHHQTRLHGLPETLLWERIIRDDEKSLLLKPFATAKQAQAAWRTLQLWCCEINREFYFHPDCSRFADWAKQFQRHCQQQQLMTFADQTRAVITAFANQQLNVEPDILLIGFQHLPPLYEELIATAANQHRHYQPPAQTPVCQKLACNDAAEEFQLAAQWAKQQLEANINQRLAIIVPDLAQQRSHIETTLAAVFEPHSLLPATARYQLPFNISAGISLNQTPLVICALNLLELLRHEFSYQTLYALLKSPFISLDEKADFASPVELELFLREGGWPQFNLSRLIQLISSQAKLKARYAAFLSALKAAQALQEQSSKKAQLSHWATLFNTLLRNFNWPGGTRRLDSIEFQHHRRWQQALVDFSRLGETTNSTDKSGKVSLDEALNLLNRVLSATDFQAQTPQTPLQILGMLEGSGLNFDAVWLLGLNDHLWPAAAKPSPFIPVSLQQQLSMPHASPERELQFSRELLTGYLQSSPQVIASYALNSDDEPLRASRLIEDFADTDLEQLALAQPDTSHPYYATLQHSKQSNSPLLEQLIDDDGPPVDSVAERVAGGSAILKDQAACPFRAFANHRLSARALPEPGYHVDAAQRGTVLHAALEQLWVTLKDSSTLLERDAASIEADISAAVRHALQPLIAQRKDLFGKVYSDTEQQRLQHLLKLWLKVEMARSPFSVVATEQALVINIAGLPLRVRIDRIDRLNDDSLLLIDYKTGFCSTAKWQGERLEEPQLPLYAITMAGLNETSIRSQDENQQGNIQSLAFARINIDQQGFVGIAAQDGVAPGIYSIEKSRGWDASQSWADINLHWQQALQSLAEEFRDGLAVVEPAQNNTCQFCHLHALCRIHALKEQSEAALT